MCGNVDGTENMHHAIAATECKQGAANRSWSVFPANTKGFYGILQLKYVRKLRGRIPPLSHFIWAIFSVKKDLTKIFNAPTKFLNNFDEIKKRKYDEP